ncbi:hypothetical protein FRX31_026186 [Thalictrum thalictroides]|uniref:Uncharacterized protein n=1 Tax=Thalictrum thalictroides TaxID=46969 RepID=A0A7J6VHI1_THATH|nr:hypothetical protein FRX31_026186 [Thalictrum thalictroides]
MLESSDDEVIEEVTTDVEPGPFKVWCPTPQAQSCFSVCLLPTEKLCAKMCGCMYSLRVI